MAAPFLQYRLLISIVLIWLLHTIPLAFGARSMTFDKQLTVSASGGYAILQSIQNDKTGSIYVAGHTNATTFDGKTNSGGQAIFIQKYSLNGTKIWSNLFGMSSRSDFLVLRDMAIDQTSAYSRLIIYGMVKGFIPLQNAFNMSANSYSPAGFIASFHAHTGARQWAWHIGKWEGSKAITAHTPSKLTTYGGMFASPVQTTENFQTVTKPGVFALTYDFGTVGTGANTYVQSIPNLVRCISPSSFDSNCELTMAPFTSVPTSNDRGYDAVSYFSQNTNYFCTPHTCINLNSGTYGQSSVFPSIGEDDIERAICSTTAGATNILVRISATPANQYRPGLCSYNSPTNPMGCIQDLAASAGFAEANIFEAVIDPVDNTLYMSGGARYTANTGTCLSSLFGISFSSGSTPYATPVNQISWAFGSSDSAAYGVAVTSGYVIAVGSNGSSSFIRMIRKYHTIDSYIAPGRLNPLGGESIVITLTSACANAFGGSCQTQPVIYIGGEQCTSILSVSAGVYQCTTPSLFGDNLPVTAVVVSSSGSEKAEFTGFTATYDVPTHYPNTGQISCLGNAIFPFYLGVDLSATARTSVSVMIGKEVCSSFTLVGSRNYQCRVPVLWPEGNHYLTISYGLTPITMSVTCYVPQIIALNVNDNVINATMQYTTLSTDYNPAGYTLLLSGDDGTTLELTNPTTNDFNFYFFQAPIPGRVYSYRFALKFTSESKVYYYNSSSSITGSLRTNDFSISNVVPLSLSYSSGVLSDIFIQGNNFGYNVGSYSTCQTSSTGVCNLYEVSVGVFPCTNVRRSNNDLISCSPVGIGRNLPVTLRMLLTNRTITWSSPGISFPEPLVFDPNGNQQLVRTGTIYSAQLKGQYFGPSPSVSLMLRFRPFNSFTYYNCANLPIITTTAVEFIACELPPSAPVAHYYVSLWMSGSMIGGKEYVFLNQAVTTPPEVYNVPTTRVSQSSTGIVIVFNGTDVDLNDSIQYYIDSFPDKGSLYMFNNGVPGPLIDGTVQAVGEQVFYIPNGLKSGPDDFTYTAKDSTGLSSSTATVYIEIDHVNQAPKIMGSNPLVVVGDADLPTNIVLSCYDTDFDDDELPNYNNYISYLIVSGPAKGILADSSNQQRLIAGSSFTINSDPYIATLTYTPIAYEFGQNYASFTYRCEDEYGLQSAALGQVNININFRNHEPTSYSSSVYMDENGLQSITLNGTDVDATDVPSLKFFIGSLPQNGVLYQNNGGAKGLVCRIDDRVSNAAISVLYEPTPYFNGNDTFEFYVEDAAGARSQMSTIRITVRSVNQEPQVPATTSYYYKGENYFSIEITATDMDENEQVTAYFQKKVMRGNWYLDQKGQTGFDFSPLTLKPVDINARPVVFSSNIYVSHDASGGYGVYPVYASFDYFGVDSLSGTSLTNGSISIVTKCDLVKYPRVWSVVGDVCGDCPNGGLCSPQGDSYPTNANGFSPDFDTISNTSLVFLPCMTEDACPEKHFTLSSFESVVSKLNLTNSFQCGAGYNETRCGNCASGYFRKNNICEICPSTEIPAGLMGFIIVVGLLVLLGLMNLIRKVDLGFFGIVVNFLQTVSLFRSFNMRWPDEVIRLFHMFSFLNLNVELVSPECFVIKDNQRAYEYKWYTTVGVPPAFFAVVFMVVLFHSLYIGLMRFAKRHNLISVADSAVKRESQPKKITKTSEVKNDGTLRHPAELAEKSGGYSNPNPEKIDENSKNKYDKNMKNDSSVTKTSEDGKVNYAKEQPEKHENKLKSKMSGSRSLIGSLHDIVNGTNDNISYKEWEDMYKNELHDDEESSKASLPIVLVSNYIIFLKFMYLSLARKTLELFDCQNVKNVYFFEAEPSRRCYEPWWYALLPYAIASCIVYVAGIPILSFYLFRSRVYIMKNVKRSQRTTWQRTILKITYKKRSEFKSQYEYWDTFVAVRKLLIVMSQLFFSKYAAFQAALLILILQGSVIVQTLYLPYSIPSLNVLETVTLVSSMIVMICGILFYVQEFKEPFELSLLGYGVIFLIIGCAVLVVLALAVHIRFLYVGYQAQKRAAKEGMEKNGA